MKTRTKVVLDEWFGRTAVVILNLIARFLGAILSIDHSLERVPKRIVVCKFLGMGSIIQATPLLQTLKKSFPDAKIIFFTSEGNRSLLESLSVVDEVMCIQDKSTASVLTSTFNALRKFWSKKIDLYIDLETYSYYSTAVATMSCARNRFGFYRVERNIRLGVYTHMMFFNARAPIAQSYLQMGRLAGCKTIVESLYRFTISDTLLKETRAKLQSLRQAQDESLRQVQDNSDIGNTDLPMVIINPNASDLRIERRWPKENFVSLLKKLHERFSGKKFLLIGSKNEFEWVKGIHDQLSEQEKQRVFNTAGMFSLHELFAIISQSEMVVTNDTGPMHISFSLGKPTISLFGPASPSQYGQNPNAFGIYKNIYCSPCVHDFLTPPCKGDNQCMKQITVDEVFNLCEELLLNTERDHEIKISQMGFLKKDGETSLGVVERG